MGHDLKELVAEIVETLDAAQADHDDDVAAAWEAGERPDLWDAPEASLAIPHVRDVLAELSRLQEENERLNRALNTPELDDFAAAVVLEGQHQRERWGAEHDVWKAPEDWFWLLGYLGGKALHAAKAGDLDKAKHHTISTAAALGSWHAQLTGVSSDMRPGVDPVARGYAALASQDQGGGDRG